MAAAALHGNIEIRRRRILFRAWHRGTREMDLVFGRFVEAHIAGLSETELGLLEVLMEMPDPDLYGWIVGANPAPAEFDTPLLQRIRDFHSGERNE